MKAAEKKKAIALRKGGESIKRIAAILGVSKGSVSFWVRDVVLTAEQRALLKERMHGFDVIERRRLARLKNESAKRRLLIDRAKQDIVRVSKHELKLIGAALYWAEGSKRGKRFVSFSNSDPVMVRLMMRFFREVCRVPNDRFRCHIHTYSHLNVRTAERYWSEVSGVPVSQFYKTYSKPSKASQGKMDALPYGTLDISVGDVRLFLSIMGWIERISGLVTGQKA